MITVTATLVGFDNSLVRASASLGATPIRTFFKVVVHWSSREWFPEPALPSSRHLTTLWL